MISSEDLDKQMEAFVRDHTAALRGFLRARFRLTDDLADEVMNDAFLVIAVKMRRGEELSAPRAYLLQVARNAAIDRLREKFRTAEAADMDAAEDRADGADLIADLDRAGDLRRLVKRLPPQQMRVIALRYLSDCSIADTAEILGITQGAVGSTTTAALRRLRQIVTEEGRTWEWDS